MADKKELFRLENVSKVFKSKNYQVTALSDVSLSIYENEIFGIIGMSGAGKSTLVRTFNRLEDVTGGKVLFENKDIGKLSKKELRDVRRSISMVFQSFNLLTQKTVLQNVMLPLKIAGFEKEKQKQRAIEMLGIVGLENKLDSYPSQLSGGQRQRVAIARALAVKPDVLLCDEATSALDPMISDEILKLLKDINTRLKITIIIITHEMSVVEKICDRVAILDHGKLAEVGRVTDVFTNPKSQAAKKLIYPTKNEVNEFYMTDKRCVRIVIDGRNSTEPIISNLVQDTGEKVNIMCSNTKSVNGVVYGQMILELPKEETSAEKVIKYLKDKNIVITEIERGGAA